MYILAKTFPPVYITDQVLSLCSQCYCWRLLSSNFLSNTGLILKLPMLYTCILFFQKNGHFHKRHTDSIPVIYGGFFIILFTVYAFIWNVNNYFSRTILLCRQSYRIYILCWCCRGDKAGHHVVHVLMSEDNPCHKPRLPCRWIKR
jgi:glucan phosphoethanolaminetransferase (alkaline phosphatase superfamily)